MSFFTDIYSEFFPTPVPVLQSDSAWALGSLVNEICLRAGIPYNKINVNLLYEYVEGFHLSCDNAAYTGIEALSSIFFFDVCNFDGVTNFIPRGGNSIATISIDDLVDDGNDIYSNQRKDSIQIPRVYHLEYYDIGGGLEPDKQTSDRSLDSRSQSEVRIQTVVLMQAETAAKKVVINHKVAIEEQRGELDISLPDSWIWLTVGDIVTFEGERFRITECAIDDGFQRYKIIYDRQSAYGSYINAVPIGTPSTAPTLVVGSTTLHFIDSHILRDSDDKLGYYVGINGASDAWSGATVELSTDGGQTYPDVINSNTSVTVGTLTDTLPSHNINYPDERNTLTVQLIKDSLELSPCTLSEMMNRANMAIVGDEIINFSNAVETSPGIWNLSYLLRGRKGTACVSHSSGERFVLLDRQRLAFVDAELYQLGRTLTFRATTFGASSGAVSSFLFSGKTQKERTPEYLSAVRDGGNIVISWQGVGRIGGGASVAMGQYFTGYRVTVNGVSQTTTSETLTIVDPGGAVTISVQQINAITGNGAASTVVI